MEFELIDQGYRSATPPERAIPCFCSRCNVKWVGCDDERRCEFCGYDAIDDNDHSENLEGKTRRN